jgi:hypothetical protein
MRDQERAVTATTAEAGSARDALLCALAGAAGPMSRSEIARIAQIDAGHVGVLLHRLSQAGLVMAATRGKWQLARPEAQLAIREPETVRPSRPVRSAGPSIDGAALLDGVAKYIGHFARFPSRACLDAVTLWAAHTHVRDNDGRLALAASPRLLLMSSEPGSGKSTVLELLNLLCCQTYGLDIEPTEAAFRSMLADDHATALLDEGDVLFGSGKRRSAIRAIINASYTRNGAVSYVRGGKINRVKVFAPVAVAGLDVMERATGGMLAAILSRSVIIRMRRPDDGTDVPDITASTAGQEAGEQGAELLSKWALGNREAILATEPELPAGVRLRPAQIWRPLLAVAEVAGGSWPERARRACAELATAVPDAPRDETEEQAESFFSALDNLDD